MYSLTSSPIHSHFFVRLVAAADAKKCYATGRGIQPKGIRARDVAVFKIHTEGAGDEIPKVGIKGPGM